MTISPSQASELLARHGLAPTKVFGQNFVVDPNTVRRIARLADVGADDRVLEIGPGLGSLTLALAETGARVTAVEVDRGLVPVVRDVVSEAGYTIDQVEVIEGDAMELDWSPLLQDLAPGRSWVMVSNLPYNIATPLICDLLDEVPEIGRMLVMVQKEVGERLAAVPGDDGYGAVSVKVQHHATAAVVAKVPPTVFLPRPKVESALVSITRRPEPQIPYALVPVAFRLVKAGFAKRRKMLRGSLAELVSAEQFVQAQVRPEARAEELSVLDWRRLAEVLTS
ncbi:MAG: 16S rRNA (adenine(1518)-N(6)/adenine(1519)-N(6))-dimethyltransferase RsmA [Acidimicrobiia bacterium]